MILDDGTVSKRRKSFDDLGHAHELTFSCFRRLQLLSKDRTCNWFIEALEMARRKYPMELWAYVIMPEHVHVLLLPLRGVLIRSVLQAIKQSVAQKAIAFLRETDPVWLEKNLRAADDTSGVNYRFWEPGGGYDRNIIKAGTVWASVNYIHRNPVRRGLAACETDWLWSSARWYAGMPSKIEMDACPPDR